MLTAIFKIRSLQLFIITLLFVSVSTCNKSSQSNSSISIEKEKIKNTLVEMWDAIEKEDIERYAQYIHPDFTQFGESDPLLLEGKKAEVSGTLAWIEDSEDIRTEMIDPKVTVRGNSAWITYYWSDHGTSGGKKFSSKGKSTRIFVKENNQWLCIHGHYTLLP